MRIGYLGTERRPYPRSGNKRHAGSGSRTAGQHSSSSRTHGSTSAARGWQSGWWVARWAWWTRKGGASPDTGSKRHVERLAITEKNRWVSHDSVLGRERCTFPTSIRQQLQSTLSPVPSKLPMAGMARLLWATTPLSLTLPRQLRPNVSPSRR